MIENLNLYKNRDVDIFIYSHIPFRPVTTDHTYKILTNSHLSPKYFNTDLEIIRDYTGDNISDKNLLFNEYSGFYWLWKNYPLKDYIGLNHYRRMYCDDSKNVLEFGNMPDINKIFETNRIILNKPFKLIVASKTKPSYILNNKDWYALWHNIDDFNKMKEVVNEKYPQYMDGWEKMEKAEYLYNSSLFTMNKECFLEYCEFIFDILNTYCDEMGFHSNDDCIKYVEERKDIYIHPERSPYNVTKQARIVGYLAERVLAAFLMHGGDNSLETHSHIFNWAMVPKTMYEV